MLKQPNFRTIDRGHLEHDHTTTERASTMLIDNKIDRYPDDGYDIKTVWDFIRTFSGRKSDEPADEQHGRLDIVTGYFTIRALAKLHRELPEEDIFRIVSSEMVGEEADRNRAVDLLNGDLGAISSLTMTQDAKDAVAFLRRNTVQVRAIVNAFCHAKAYMFKNNKPHGIKYHLTGSSNLTDAGLGLRATSNVELNMGNVSQVNDNDYNEVCSWFEDIFKAASEQIPSDPTNKQSTRIDVKEYFIRQIEQYFRKYTPEEIYYKVLFELFRGDLDIDDGIEHQKDMSLLQTSVIWKTLFNYQQKGVISLIKMLRKYNGAILADAVGLGKTFSALAVIKYFQTQNYLTVVLCPKKLEENWTQYLRRHQSRFEKDEFDYLVRFHTDLQNDRLENAYTDARLSYLQSRKKVLVVIDESHNLRNDKSNRYIDLLDNLIKSRAGQEGRDVKVLMLSATPINTGLNDVKGQFKLIAHGEDEAFNTEDFGIDSLHNLFKDAQSKYTDWCKQPQHTIGQFISKLPPRFFNLTDRLIVARTRSLIEKTLGEDLGFPCKAKPVNVYQGVDHFGNYQTTEEIFAAFEGLALTAYLPSLFIPESRKKAKKEASKTWDDDVNRETFLVKMMGVLFMKRLESSWYSCMTTVKKVLDVHEHTLQMVLDFEETGKAGDVPSGNDDTWDDDDMEEFALRKGSIRLTEMKNLGGFKRGLQGDVKRLKEIYCALQTFEKQYRAKKEQDVKLDELEKILTEKAKAKNKKVVIFTAYADTARFLFDELKVRNFSRMALASGQEVRSTGKHSTSRFTEVLQSFAPYSKLYKELDWSSLYEEAKLDRATYYNDEKQRWDVPYTLWQKLVRQYDEPTQHKLDDGIDILIATDCLSEGQNLQDADMQVNYDIHWNPVRLIQRFGRIDRIGSPNKLIKCVNFWPAKSFEDYLHLETRIQNRMSLMNLVGSETQELNDTYQKMVEDNPLQDLNADRLLKELTENSISDIESRDAQTLSLKDFSFETYRQDIIDYLEQRKQTFLQMPNAIYSGFRSEDTLFDHIPESLVAVVGYPRRPAGSDKPYQELYLMCQPMDSNLPGAHVELNRAEVLELLRVNKLRERYVPEWLETGNKERVERLSQVLKDWMRMKAPKQASAAILDIARMPKGGTRKKIAENQLVEEKFRLENFDLIVWEYVSK